MVTGTHVYKLRGLISDPVFKGFSAVKGTFLDTIPRARTSTNWQITRVAGSWAPPQLTGTITSGNDYPCVNLISPAFSWRAVECLRDLLEPNGEVLPLRPENGAFFAYNLTTVADVLDLTRSEITWTSSGYCAISISRYEFREQCLKKLSIFRLPQHPGAVYVTDLFRSRVIKHGLGGFDFQLLWPLPPGALWSNIAKRVRKDREKGRTFDED